MSLVGMVVGMVVPLVAGLAAGLAVDLLAGFSAVSADWEPEALGLSSSEKLLFNHLDGKHMPGTELVEEGGVGDEKIRKGDVRWWAFFLCPVHFISREHLTVRENC